jgi:lipoprotein NlpI
MRRLILIVVATVALGFAAAARAQQAGSEYTQLCSDPEPSVRLLACSVIIELKQASGAGLADAYASRGTADLILGSPPRAIADFTQALALDPRRVLVFGYRGNAFLATGDNDAAIADFDRAIELDPNYADARYGRATAARNKGDNDRAIADYTKVLEIDPNYLDALAYRGIAYRAKEDFSHAIADFDRLIQHNPNDPQAYNLRGGVYRDMGDTGNALGDFDAALKLAPDNVSVLDNRGFTELFSAHYSEAASDFAHAMTLQPAYPYRVLWLDLARRKAGQAHAEELSRNRARLNLTAWPAPLIRLYDGQATGEEVRAAAGLGPTAKAQTDRACEFAFYMGELSLAGGDRTMARAELQKAAMTCPHSYLEYGGAVRELSGLD